MEKLNLKDGCEFTHVAAIATVNIALLGVGVKLVLTQSDPRLCASYCIMFSAILLVFLSIYGVQRKQRLMMLGVAKATAAENWDVSLHILGLLRMFNSLIGGLLLLLALGAEFHPTKLHPISF